MSTPVKPNPTGVVRDKTEEWDMRRPQFIQRTPHKCPKCDGKGWLGYDPTTGLGNYRDVDPVTGLRDPRGVPWRCDVCESGIIWSKP